MSKLADLVEQHTEEMAALDGADAGKLVLLGKVVNIPAATQMLRYYAGAADKIHGEVLRVSGKYQGHTLKEPVGVVGVIIPWNFPSMMFFLKVSSALVAECAIVIKPAEQTPLSALFYAHLAREAGVPDGVINVVPGLASYRVRDLPDGAVSGDFNYVISLLLHRLGQRLPSAAVAVALNAFPGLDPAEVTVALAEILPNCLPFGPYHLLLPNDDDADTAAPADPLGCLAWLGGGLHRVGLAAPGARARACACHICVAGAEGPDLPRPAHRDRLPRRAVPERARWRGQQDQARVVALVGSLFALLAAAALMGAAVLTASSPTLQCPPMTPTFLRP